MVYVFINNYCYSLSFCSDKEFDTLNRFKKFAYKWCMKRILKSFRYDKTTKFICDKDSIKTCLMLSKYLKAPSIIDMDGVSYLNTSDFWEKFYAVRSE